MQEMGSPHCQGGQSGSVQWLGNYPVVREDETQGPNDIDKSRFEEPDMHYHAPPRQGNTAKPPLRQESVPEDPSVVATDDGTLVDASSEIESIFSDNDSIASSFSSTSELRLSALSQLVNLFLHHAELKPLCTLAISKVGPEKFQRNFGAFCYIMADLQNEASNPLEIEAAKFVRRSARHIAGELEAF